MLLLIEAMMREERRVEEKLRRVMDRLSSLIVMMAHSCIETPSYENIYHKFVQLTPNSYSSKKAVKGTYT